LREKQSKPVPDLSVEYADKGIIISCCPKDGELANDVVRKFRGDTIAVVGEWQGHHSLARAFFVDWRNVSTL
jgi:hypothetical protein